jgi:hypothetical protein
LPNDGEVLQIAMDRAAAIKATNELATDRMERHYNEALDYVDSLHVVLLKAATDRVGFILGDNPVVLQRGVTVGVHHGIAFKDANAHFMPLTRWTAMTLTPEPRPDAIVSPADMQALNRLSWRNSLRFIACHPDEDWRRACALGSTYVPSSRT